MGNVPRDLNEDARDVPSDSRNTGVRGVTASPKEGRDAPAPSLRTLLPSGATKADIKSLVGSVNNSSEDASAETSTQGNNVWLVVEPTIAGALVANFGCGMISGTIVAIAFVAAPLALVLQAQERSRGNSHLT